MPESCALVAVAGGSVYERYAETLMESAREHFRPTPEVEYIVLPGIEGWPEGTLCRHEVLLANFPHTNYIYLVDADARFEAPVGDEVLPPNGLGITATRHPGYVTTAPQDLPYERNPDSYCMVTEEDGDVYFCGGFFGGERTAVRILLTQTTMMLELDESRGLVPRFHDESALNRALVSWPPMRVLDPDMAHPDNDAYYRTFWPTDWNRKLVMLDKTQDERGER